MVSGMCTGTGEAQLGEGQAERGTHLKCGGLKNSTKDRAREMLKTPTEGVV